MSEQPADQVIREADLLDLLATQIEDQSLVVVDHAGIITGWSHGAERLLGYGVAEVFGKSANLLLTPQDVRDQTLAQDITNAGSGGRTARDGWLVAHNGTPIPTRTKTVAIRADSAEHTQFVQIIQDRSKDWELPQNFRQHEAVFQSLYHHPTIGLVIGKVSGEFVDANPAYLLLIGHTLGQLRERTTESVIHPADAARYAGFAEQLLDGRIASFAVEQRHIHATGLAVWMKASVSLIRDAAGRPDQLVTVVEPMDQQKQFETVAAEQFRLATYIREINVHLTTTKNSREMLGRVANTMVEYLEATLARIWTLDPTGTHLELQASAGLYTHLDGLHQRIPVGQFKIGRIAAERAPHLTNAVIGDPLIPAQDWAKAQGLVSFAGYPLIVEDRLVGVLGMFARHPLSDLTIQAMKSVADGIALGIERKTIEERLEEEREWLRVTLASIGEGVITTDTAGRVTFLNEVASALTGWSAADAAGRPMEEIFAIINETTRQVVEHPVGRVIREGQVVGLANHTVLIARDGTETAIEDSAAPIRDRAGKIIGVVMVFRDASVERQHAAELRQSEARFRQMAAAIAQLAWMAEPDGSIFWYNQRWYDYTGTSFEEMQGWGWRAVHDPAMVGEVEARFRAALAGGKTFDMTFPLRGADGIYRPFLTKMLPIKDEMGRVIRWVGTNTDITEQRRIEAEAQAARAEAETANKAKDHFLAILSHELRTPLNPILLATTSMLELPADPDEVRSTLKMIRQNVLLQSRLIDDLLDVMRIVRGKMPLHWEVADCHRLIHQSQQICQSEVFGKKLHLEIDLKAPDHHINADPARLQQVFWNLIKNAVKFTPAGGTIQIRSRNEVVDGQKQLVITISDTGIGIDSAVLPLVFDPFQQGEKEITRKFGGLGLGLAICKGIVDSHGGTITVRSAGLGKGTTFEIILGPLPETLAVESVDQPMAGTPDDAGASPASLRILLVEDEPATMRIMARLLKRLGHAVTTAGSIAAAYRLIETESYDLIVSDIGLPDGTGLDLMRRVTQLRGPVPAIALTGYGMEEDILRSRAAGFTAHMTKPIDFTKLEVMIRQVAPQKI